MTDNVKSLGWWMGVGLAIFVSVAAGYVANWFGVTVLGFAKSPVSAIMMAIVLGMLIANIVKLPPSIQPGLKFCTSFILRIGIMLLGIRLSLAGAGQFTLVALPFVIAAIAIGLFTVGLLGRYMGLSRQLSGLIAVGTSICGCTAIVATAPLIKANESEVSYAIACITVFGLAAMFFYPFLAHQVFATQPELAGLFLGTSIHETAQVAGAGMMYEAQYNAPVALDIATVTKLVRNLCMIAVIPLVGILYGPERSKDDSTKINFLAMIPWFIVGFALMSAIRTIGDIGDKPFGVLEPGQWKEIVAFLKESAERCLLVAMAAVGLTSMLAGIVKIGMRPFALGLFAAVLIGGVSFALISLFGADLIALLV
ncbi:MAG: putative sulfate exporter family transporter [Gammaproteobacteria bacterium]|nr:putative sulfate exporter family transporter [Gammaproteobacteria bacterium]